VIGDIYTLEERGRMQGVFSGVWAFASVAGPAMGGLLTDTLSWRWVFLINVPFGVLSALILMLSLREQAPPRGHALDVAGTLALTFGIGLLLLGVQEGGAAWGWRLWPTGAALAAAVALLALFVRQERRAPEPMLPIDLFRQRLIGTASLGNVVIGTLLFALTAFVPMYAQGVRGASAAEAGAVLMPMLLGWPIASTLAGWLLMRLGYRTLGVIGSLFALAGGLLITRVAAPAHPLLLPAAVATIGIGLGFLSTPLMVAVQAAVPWQRRGVATSSQQFFRTIGGALAVGTLGAVLNADLARHGLTGLTQAALVPGTRATLSADEIARVSAGLAGGLHTVFVVIAVVAAAAVAVALAFPRGSAQAHAWQPTR
jgi:MFS family permease